MQIDIWFDFVCPFCYIEKKRLTQALQKIGLNDQVDIVYKAFEIDPNVVADVGKSVVEVLAEDYRISMEEAHSVTEKVAFQAETVGMVIDFASLHPANTFHAHRLVKYAATQSLAATFIERIFQAYFIEQRKIGSFETLIELAGEVGLSQQQAKRILNSEHYIEAVHDDAEEAGQIGVQSVPFFVVNRKYAIAGVHTTEELIGKLSKI